jgi:peptide/nickel transport system permease protein
MVRYIVLRVIQGIVTTLAIVSLVFVLVRVSGDPLTWLVSKNATPEVRQQIAAKYGLDRSVIVQYGVYLGNVLQGKFGDSFLYRTPVVKVIALRVPATLELSVVGLLIAVLLGILIGVYSAQRRGKWIDFVGRGVAFLGMSAPPFVVGMILIYVFAVKAKLLPVGGRFSLVSVILPAATFSLWLVAGGVRITRSAVLEGLGAHYLVFARAKGVSERLVLWKHAFKNASIPIVTYVMFLLVIAVSGDVVIESVFSWPGLGRLTIEAVMARDYPLVQAIALIIVFLFIVISLIADIAYFYLNPKIRYQQKG